MNVIRIADLISVKQEYLHYYFSLGTNYAIVEQILYNRNTCLPSVLLVKWLDGKTNDTIVIFHHATKINSEDDDD